MTREESARRLRAAWGYSLKQQGALAVATGIDGERIRNLLRTTGAPIATPEEMAAIADACGVPDWFLDYGFGKNAEGETIAEQVARIDAQLEQMILSGAIRASGDAVRAPKPLGRDAAPSAPAKRGRRR